MRAVFLALILLVSMLNAKNSLRLETHIRIVPKLISLCHANTKEPITIGVIYDDTQKTAAQAIASQMNELHNRKSGTLTFNAIAVSVDELVASKNIGFLYLLSMKKESVQKIVFWSQKHTVPSFSYNMSDLEDGVLGSINLERSTMIYMSKSALKEGKFPCADTLINIVKFVR